LWYLGSDYVMGRYITPERCQYAVENVPDQKYRISLTSATFEL
jgi:hypothetical protein